MSDRRDRKQIIDEAEIRFGIFGVSVKAVVDFVLDTVASDQAAIAKALADASKAAHDASQQRIADLETRLAEAETALQEVARLREALEAIRSREHSDTCSHSLVPECACDCHVSIAEAALANCGGTGVKC